MSKALGSRLTQLRESLGLSKAEVARRLHVGNTTYSNWEYGLREPNIDMIVTLADFFDVSTDYLLGRDSGIWEVKEPAVHYDLGEDEPPIIKRLGEPCYISQFLPDCTYWSGTYYESSLS